MTKLLPFLLAFAALAGCSSNDDAPTAAGPPAGDAGLADVAPPCVPVAAASETVRVPNDRGTLEGTLDVPEGCGRMPVVVILSGSGSTDRNGNAPGGAAKPDLYRILAKAINGAGYATLRYDDPGVAQSATAIPPKVEDLRYEMEVHAAALFVAKLRSDDRFGAIVAAGHSQGSLTGILSAAEQPIDGFISLAGAGRRIGVLLREQLEPRLTRAQLATLDAAIAKLESGALAGDLGAPLDAVLPLALQPYMISWMKFDPQEEIAKLAGPALIVQGKMDVQVQVLDAQLLAKGKADASTLLVDDMGHMQRKTTAKDAASQQDTYTEPLPIDPAVVTAIADFLGSLPKK